MRFFRVWKYARKYRKLVITSFIALILSVGLELLSPYLLKVLIDEHIVGIENEWYVVEDEDKYTVEYDDYILKQKKNFTTSQKEDVDQYNVKRVLLIKYKYYFVDSNIIDGEKSIVDNQLVVKGSDETETYSVALLTKDEVFSFYKTSLIPIFKIAVLFIGTSICAIGLVYFYRFNFMELGNKITYDIRTEAFDQLQRLHISYYDKTPAGKIVARITNDTDTIRELFSRVIVVFVSAFVYFIGIYTGLFMLNTKLALISLVLIPIIIVWGTIYRKSAKKYNEVIRSENSEINAYLNESIKGMEVTQAFNHEELSFDEFQSHNKKFLEYKNKMLKLNASLSGNMVRTLHRVIYIGILLYFGWGALGIQGVVQVGVIYAFTEYMNRLINPINQIFNNLEVFEQSLVSADRIFYLLDQDGIDMSSDKTNRYKGDIEFQGLNFAYEENNYILKDINLKVDAGQTIALVGHTGSGKSSLMNVLLRYYDYTEGKITIDGLDIRDYSKQAYRKHVGIVLQDPVLFTGTIASNISLSNELITDSMVEDALKEIGASHLIDKFEKGIHEDVLDMGSNFSVGERQLISFARAMVYDPAVLVLDEATANIDTETEGMIQKALNVVKKNRTTFVIAHRLSTIKDANQIIVLEKGRIVERGTHDELMDKQGIYYKMYESQMNEL